MVRYRRTPPISKESCLESGDVRGNYYRVSAGNQEPIYLREKGARIGDVLDNVGEMSNGDALLRQCNFIEGPDSNIHVPFLPPMERCGFTDLHALDRPAPSLHLPDKPPRRTPNVKKPPRRSDGLLEGEKTDVIEAEHHEFEELLFVCPFVLEILAIVAAPEIVELRLRILVDQPAPGTRYEAEPSALPVGSNTASSADRAGAFSESFAGAGFHRKGLHTVFIRPTRP